MAEPYIGQIIMFGGNFAIRGYAYCSGQLLPISQYTALFSILGTTYGGDGVTTFALPDLRGRVPIHSGQGPGLSNYQLGQRGGSESVTLLQERQREGQVDHRNTSGKGR
jgi:microcystin-dependent protein